MIGVRADGRKELIALADGYRESTESWCDLLRDCARRGMRAPVLAAGDGGAGVLGCAARGIPRDPRAALLVPQDGVRHRTKVTKGPGSRAAGLAMAFKLIQSAQDHWRSVSAPHLVALVRAGAVFSNGVLIERPEQAAA